MAGDAPESKTSANRHPASDQQSSIRKTLVEIQMQANKMSLGSVGQFSLLQAKIQATLKQPQRWDSIQSGQEAFAELHYTLFSVNNVAFAVQKEISVLGRLWFDAMHTREESVEDPEADTFEWMVSEPKVPGDEGEESVHSHSIRASSSTASLSDVSAGGEENTVGDPDVQLDFTSVNDEVLDELLRGNDSEARELEHRKATSEAFLSFLQNDNGVFFICGKAGSGKSTMMKFLGDNSRVGEKLEAWAGTRKLVFVRVFFWNSGDKLQMSKEGFYRSVLFKVLRECPDLCQHAFPDVWSQAQSWPPPLGAFPLRDITKAFNKLSATSQFPDFAFCFFIDGLDEFESKGIEHDKLAQSLRSWATAPNVKIVCAARPISDFLDTFPTDKTIHLNKMTRRDIGRYAQAMFVSALRSMKDNGKTPNLTAKDIMDLMEKILDRADGVFLWARLVVRFLIQAMTKRATSKTMQEMLEGYPKDLNGLFNKMLEGVDSLSQNHSDRLLLMAIHNPFDKPLNALAYSWVERLDDERFPYDDPYEGYDRAEVQKRHDDVRHQLELLTNGLLEMRHSSGSWTLYFDERVEFFHRTVRDFLKNEWERKAVLSKGSFCRNPDTYCRLRLAEAKCANSLLAFCDDHPGQYWDALRDIYQETFVWLHRVDECRPAYMNEFSRILFSCRSFLNRTGSKEFPEPDLSRYQLPPYWPRTSLAQDSTCNILLLAAMIPDADLVGRLLKSGSSPNDEIEVARWHSDSHQTDLVKITAWTGFLRLFALEIWKVGAWHSSISYHCNARLRLYAPVIEALLRAGADPTVVFLAGDGGQVGDGWELGRLGLYNMKRIRSKVPQSHKPVHYIELRQLLAFLGSDYALEPVEKPVKTDPGANDWERAEAMPNLNSNIDYWAHRLYGVASQESILTGVFWFY